MKTLLVRVSFLTFLAVFLVGCINTSNNGDMNTSNADSNNADSIALTNLIRDVYKWHEGDSIKVDFRAATKDSIQTGIDWDIHKNRMNQLLKTNFFSKEFLDSYNSFALQLDSLIKNGKINSDIFMIPKPIDDTHDMWCNFPWKPENYWETLTITNLKSYKDSATFRWTWGYNHYYSVKVLKESDKWKISYLEGLKKFDLRTQR